MTSIKLKMDLNVTEMHFNANSVFMSLAYWHFINALTILSAYGTESVSLQNAPFLPAR